MPRPPFLTALQSRPLLLDGAMGTQLFLRGLAPGACGEAWCIDRPTEVKAIHQAYLDAGCDAVTTNTFGGCRTVLDRHGRAGDVTALNRAAAEVARQAAGEDRYVLGDIGPFGDFLEPMGLMTTDELLSIFTEQAQALYEGGADGIIIETMTDGAEARVAIQAAKQVADWPVLSTFAFDKGVGAEFRTMMGQTAEELAKLAAEAGADVVGANCGTSLGLNDYVELARQLVRGAGSTPVIVQPNAGAPRNEGDRVVYDATPADMAGLAQRLRGVGVRVIGGCCGTTPEHLAAMRHAVR